MRCRLTNIRDDAEISVVSCGGGGPGGGLVAAHGCASGDTATRPALAVPQPHVVACAQTRVVRAH